MYTNCLYKKDKLTSKLGIKVLNYFCSKFWVAKESFTYVPKTQFWDDSLVDFV